jgi:hypothetical protein
MAIPRRTHAPSVLRSVAQPAPTERRPPGVKTASARPPTTGAAAGFTRGASCGLCEAAYNNRSPAGFTDGGRRSVDAAGTRTATQRRVGGWSATRGTPWVASGSPRTTGADGAAPSMSESGLGEAAYYGAPAGCAVAKHAASSRPPKNRSPAGFTDGGRRSVDAAGTRTAAHRRVGGWSATRGLTLGCIGFATRNRRRRSGALHGSTRPRRGRRQGCTRRVCCRETRGLGEATSNGYPQGSRGAHPAAFARPPTRVHPEGVLLGMPRGARGGPAVSDVQ